MLNGAHFASHLVVHPTEVVAIVLDGKIGLALPFAFCNLWDLIYIFIHDLNRTRSPSVEDLL